MKTKQEAEIETLKAEIERLKEALKISNAENERLKNAISIFQTSIKDINLTNTLSTKAEIENDKFTFSNATYTNLQTKRINAFIFEYPTFEKHFQILKENGYLEELTTGFLKWNKKKSTLAKYIDYISEKEMTNWKIAEQTFRVKNLYANYKKESKDDEFNELKTLINIK